MADYEPLDTEAQDKKLQERKDKIGLEQKSTTHDLKRMMGTDFGRRIIWRLLGDTGVFSSSFRLNNEMAYLEGRRSVGLEMLVLINQICPENYILMIQEANKK